MDKDASGTLDFTEFVLMMTQFDHCINNNSNHNGKEHAIDATAAAAIHAEDDDECPSFSDCRLMAL